ncbi:MAG: hypothetical protein M1828_002029 [Chrysothrix sp. TS-e1954]|nr:MAG: hypothetical protein M1828_002029 [Chrysothrix sp. TS-e1954]
MPKLLSLVGPAILFSLSLPLTVLAVATTVLAFSTLFLRVSIVYVELGLALISSWLSALFIEPIDKPKERIMSLQPPTPQPRANSLRQSFDAGIILPPATTIQLSRSSRNPSFASLVGNNGPDRDFEGVGGWRVSRDMREDAIWMGLNSRLELPGTVGQKPRTHHRSLSSQSHRVAKSPEEYKRHLSDSRPQTPPATSTSNFGEVPGASSTNFTFRSRDGCLMSLEESAARSRMEQRRRSLSSTSGASITSSISDRKHGQSMQFKMEPT